MTSHHRSPAGKLLPRWFLYLALLAILTTFFFSIELLADSIKLFGAEFAKSLFTFSSSPGVSLLIGIVATTLMQSSSASTTIMVGLVSSGSLPLELAVPMIMGANIGTTVTNTLVSLAHVKNPAEFRRAFSCATVHDFFNILSVILFFPLEIYTGILSRSGQYLAGLVEGSKGLTLFSPVKALLKPAIHGFLELVGNSAWVGLACAVVLLYLAIVLLTKVLRGLFMRNMENAFQGGIFDNGAVAFLMGIGLTFLVQSSSITTSMVIPMAGAGLLTIQQVFPYTLGANIGTTITAFMASLITGNHNAVVLAMVHLSFNAFGTLLFWPLKRLPIFLAESLASLTLRSKLYPLLYVLMVFVLLPLAAIYLMG
jgi:sodium-dependent phosphate cotransporter